MKVWLISVFLLLVYISHAKANETEKYIQKQINKLSDGAIKGEFVKGRIITDRDTLHLEILQFKGKKKLNNYLFCVARLKNDSIIVYRAENILEYKAGDKDIYVKHVSGNEHFFLHQEIEGKAKLYKRIPFPGDQRLLYYIKMRGLSDYLVLDPAANNIENYTAAHEQPFRSDELSRSYITTNGIPEKFKLFVSTYFSDCKDVVNRVDSGFYTINDIPAIINLYNRCE